MHNSPLTPTVIIDKNGRTTTVHKRDEGTKSRSNGTLPRPAITPSTTSSERSEALRTLNYGLPSPTSENGIACRDNIQTYPTDLLQKLAKLGAEDFYRVSPMLENCKSADEVKQFLHFKEDTSMASSTASSFLVSSLYEYDQLPDSPNYGEEDDHTRAQCSALLKVASAAYTIKASYEELDSVAQVMITDPRVVDMVINNPERADDIVDHIMVRNTVDADLIEALLSGNPLHPGWL